MLCHLSHLYQSCVNQTPRSSFSLLLRLPVLIGVHHRGHLFTIRICYSIANVSSGNILYKNLNV